MVIQNSRIIRDLRKKGYRITPQREKILQLFYELPEGTHLNAEELLAKLEEKNLKVSLATLYRTLKLLSSIGLIRELDFAEDHKHYELATGKTANHHHIICVSCNSTIEVQNKTLQDISKKLAKEHNFKLIDIQLKLFGLCEKCFKQTKT